MTALYEIEDDTVLGPPLQPTPFQGEGAHRARGTIGLNQSKSLCSGTSQQGRRMSDRFTFGIEEEYFLVDAKTKRVANDVPQAFFDAARAASEGRVSPEFLQPQIEVISSPHTCMADARAELRHLRQTVAAVAAEHGLAILAAGTHPTALWRSAQQTQKERYDAVMLDLQMIGQRDLLCGLHIHVALPDPDERVDVMCRMLPYLPLFLALSTSSPFWQSRATGLMGYRLAAYDELPRTGVPELFRTREEFDAYVAALVRAGVIQDSSFIWWAIRPSLNNPTLELRAPDSCTLVEDSIAIAALYRTVARHLYFNRWRNADINAVSRAIAVENKWQAQRRGVHATFVTDEGPMTVAEVLDRVIEETAADAAAFGCAAEIGRCRAIVGSGTSADAQLAVFDAQRKGGEDREAALRAVTDWIAAATLQ
jgi:glutamate---cysteine ligase / carboxylate-amine ligase